MKLPNHLGSLVLAALCLTLLAGNARADFITAYGWVTTEAHALQATPAMLSDLACHNGAGACTHANADVTFTTEGLNLAADSTTIAAWLASSSFPLHNVVNNAPGSLMDPTLWEFVGTISVTSSPQTFSITHDDGVTFTVNGETVINAPFLGAPVMTTGTYTGAAGDSVPFSLIYAECCSGPAVLQVDLPAPVPEPAGILLLGTVFVGVAAAVRRRRSA